MCFVYHDRIYAKLLKGNKVILSALIRQRFQLFLQFFLLAFHLFYSPSLSVTFLHLINRIADFINLLVKHSFLSLCGNWNFLKLRVRHDDTVIVTCCNP